MPQPTLYWHDYETFGADPRGDRPVQFAGQRTDLDLNPIGEPLVLYSRPTPDALPQPAACMVTGISPQQALQRGIPEVEFIRQIEAELGAPGTCGVGYNSLRFDDEVTRNTLYRNLLDPYQREWKQGNSRWDLIDLMRITRALRPEGIEWPLNEEGVNSMRLEHLTAANGIDHGNAHDALADVEATIALARLVRKHQPRLYHYIFEHRTKQRATDLLNLQQPTPLLHVSGMYPANRHHLAVVLPLTQHSNNNNGVIAIDLAEDPTPFLELDAESIRQRLFTRSIDLPDGVKRIPVKTIHINRCPVLAPLNTLDHTSQRRLKIDLDQQLARIPQLLAAPHFIEQLQQAHLNADFKPESDPDRMIYSGFFGDSDRQTMARIHRMTPLELATTTFQFDDSRLQTMLFRFRARNWPETLDASEQERWRRFCQHRIMDTDGGGTIHWDRYQEEIIQLRQQYLHNEPKLRLLQQLQDYGELLLQSF